MRFGLSAGPILFLMAAGCAGFRGESDPHGHFMPVDPNWSIGGSNSEVVPGWSDSVFIRISDMKEYELLRVGGPGGVVNGKSVTHGYRYYRFFSGGRVVFSVLPVDDETAGALRAEDGTIGLPRDISFGDHPGTVGYYDVKGKSIRIELFTHGYAHSNWLGGGAANVYRLEEGELTETGFTITRVSERHRSSTNNREVDVAWEVVRVPVQSKMMDKAHW